MSLNARVLSAGCASLPSNLASRFPVDDRTLARSPAVADDNDDSVGLKNNDFIDDGVGVGLVVDVVRRFVVPPERQKCFALVTQPL